MKTPLNELLDWIKEFEDKPIPPTLTNMKEKVWQLLPKEEEQINYLRGKFVAFSQVGDLTKENKEKLENQVRKDRERMVSNDIRAYYDNNDSITNNQKVPTVEKLQKEIEYRKSQHREVSTLYRRLLDKNRTQAKLLNFYRPLLILFTVWLGVALYLIFEILL